MVNSVFDLYETSGGIPIISPLKEKSEPQGGQIWSITVLRWKHFVVLVEGDLWVGPTEEETDRSWEWWKKAFHWGERGELPKSGIDFSRGPPEQALSWFWVLVKSCREDIDWDSSNCCIYGHLNSEAA